MKAIMCSLQRRVGLLAAKAEVRQSLKAGLSDVHVEGFENSVRHAHAAVASVKLRQLVIRLR